MNRSLPVRIAQCAIETYVREGRTLSAAEAVKDNDTGTEPEVDLSVRSACFVSLHLKGELRGCIGTILPTMGNLVSEIIRNAICACSEDPRFEPVGPEELALLEIAVDILGKPESVEDASFLDPERYGVIVSTRAKRGVLLPALDGVDSVPVQLAIALRKAGITPDEPYTIQRFTVERYE